MTAETMDAGTLKALRESVAHWERNVAAESPKDVRLGIAHCALCTIFYRRTDGLTLCAGCPVQASTKQPYCRGTPYNDAERRSGWRTDEGRDAFRTAAQAMLDFLRGLLPADATQPISNERSST